MSFFCVCRRLIDWWNLFASMGPFSLLFKPQGKCEESLNIFCKYWTFFGRTFLVDFLPKGVRIKFGGRWMKSWNISKLRVVNYSNYQRAKSLSHCIVSLDCYVVLLGVLILLVEKGHHITKATFKKTKNPKKMLIK